ncbi:CHASE domain-containing protein [Aromatoleum toluclasticum]|uniref:CHASE domain-containing protein n=1 Tax=Aromatoleum toluclasticum TaxID=92003 RepID=UPI001D19535A|nr:CHASE domain-containing protein [Aromatoleum toluclasticum]MCC4116588.1 CHASE domain-containing protein [Aromatoleum toluclasticum]
MSKRTLVFPLAVILIGLAVALGVARQTAETNRQTANARFEALATRTSSALVARFQTFEYGLRGARGAIIGAGSESIPRQRFLQYAQSREADREFPGARGFGFIRRVDPADEADFVAAVRHDGRPDFRIKQFAPHAGERFVILHVEPEANNREAIGLDIASELNRRTAALAAVRTGRPVLTTPLTLLQAMGKPERGFVLLLPVYRGGYQPATPEERWKSLLGWVYAPLIIDDVLADFDFRGGEFAVSIYDAAYAEQPFRFYESPGSDQETAAGLISQLPVELYGRQWFVEVRALAPFYKALNLPDPRWFAAGILALAALLASLAYIYLQNVQRRIGASAAEARHAALAEQGARQQLIAERLQLATEAAGMGVAEYRREDGSLSWDARLLDIYGLSAEDFPGRLEDWLSHVVANDRPAVGAAFDCALKGGAFDSSFRIVRPDGAERIVRSLGRAQRSATGETLRVVSVTLDVTEQRQNEEALRQSERFLSAVTENIPTMIAYWDDRLRCRFVNRALLAFLGKRAVAVSNAPMEAIFEPSLYETSRPYVEAALAGQPQKFQASSADDRRGGVKHLWWHLVPDHDGGRVRGVYAVVSDVSELKEAQIRLEELNVELTRQSELAQAGSRAKSEFLANMSHEIRTPMNAVLGLAYLLDRAELPPAARELARKIQRAGRSLLGILNDILDFSKIEAHRLDIEHQPFRLAEVLDELASTMAYACEGKPVEVAVWPPPPGTEFLTGDALRLRQVLTNLASNAIKFTEQGEVVLRVALAGHEGDGLRLRFTVSDTGIGIPPEMQEEIFSPFSQADTSTSRRFGGTGLGLAISRQLVGLMGGQLGLRSEPGQGSEFFFELPFTIAEMPAAPAPALGPRRVLIVDDHPLVRETLGAVVMALGWTAELADSGPAAIDAARARRDAGQPFDIVLLDWRMPGMDGLATAAAMRVLFGSEAQPAIVMVTAADREALRGHPDSRFADRVLTKPVTGGALLETVMELAAGRGGRVAGTPFPTQSGRLAGYRVLVVDDSDINREVAQGILEGEGAQVAQAEHGEAALALLEGQTAEFDAVLMDVQMPVMDGYEATRRIRASEALQTLPVIAVSAGAFHDQHEAALQAGMSGFVSKPFAAEDLISALQAYAARRTPPAAPTPSVPALALAPIAAPAGELLLDAALGLRLWRDAKTYATYLQRFVDTYGEDPAKLRTFVHTGDVAAAAGVAHKLRGAAGAMGLSCLATAAGETEMGLQDGSEARGTVECLDEAMDATLAEIGRFLAAAPKAPVSGAHPDQGCATAD